MEERRKIPVIIDTDIGDDIDDAFALAIAMRLTQLDLLGVTTVHKNSLCRAKMAKKLLTLGGFSHIPVVAGCSKPLAKFKLYGKEIDYTQKPMHYTDDIDNEQINLESDAATFIINTLEYRESPIVIITIGALTNIAEVIRRRPDLECKIEKIVIMGGAYNLNYGEYNFSCDPEAADIVLSSGIKLLAVGLDVTFKCKLSKESLMSLRQKDSPCIKYLMKMCNLWGGEVYLHDPLAVLVAIDDSYVKLEKRVCAVELYGKYTRGIVVNLSDHNWNRTSENANLHVCVDVDAEKVVSSCLDILMSY